MGRPCVEPCRLEVTAPQQRRHTVTQWGARKEAARHTWARQGDARHRQRRRQGTGDGHASENEENERSSRAVASLSRSKNVLPTVDAPVYMDAPS